MKEYEPYGDEWRKEVMKLTKAQIVGILRTECMKARKIKTVEAMNERETPATKLGGRIP